MNLSLLLLGVNSVDILSGDVHRWVGGGKVVRGKSGRAPAAQCGQMGRACRGEGILWESSFWLFIYCGKIYVNQVYHFNQFYMYSSMVLYHTFQCWAAITTVHFHTCWIFLLYLTHESGIIKQFIFFCVLLISLSKIPLGFIHVVAGVGISFMIKYIMCRSFC
jgi:hypothetical protein